MLRLTVCFLITSFLFVVNSVFGPQTSVQSLTRLTVTPEHTINLNPTLSDDGKIVAFGPAAGLEVIDALRSDPALESYHLLPSVRGDLLAKLGRLKEARAELKRAAELTRNVRERQLLLKKIEAL